ncbi:MAG: hypothetical protein J0M08_00380 [Bacteroidetes bacterium]|nr:hypothetical protein [Bacteroidota bacterium]
MSSAEIKIQLYRLIDSTNDKTLLQKIYNSIAKKIGVEKGDWWDTITDNEKAIIEEGDEQIEAGNVVSNAQVALQSKKLINKYRK